MKLLFVEDEKELSDAISTLLKENNYEVKQVFDGQEALDALKNDSFDLIILDIMLPKVDGLTVLKNIRSEKNLTPVILLTALGDEKTKVNGLELGADDYITKPFSSNELIARIRAILRRVEKSDTDTLSFGDLSLNLLNYDLCANSRCIRVSAKEYAIIKLFLENSNRVLSKNEIVAAIWNTDEELESNTVEVYLSFVRRKFDFLKTKVNIVSVRGVGYRVEYNV